MYKLQNNSIQRLSDNAIIPFANGNKDYEEYKEWVSEGNVAEIVSPEPQNISTISMAQCRLMLLDLGLLSQVDGLIDGMEEPQRSAARIEWEYRTDIKKDHILVQTLAQLLELDSTRIDELFIIASTL